MQCFLFYFGWSGNVVLVNVTRTKGTHTYPRSLWSACSRTWGPQQKAGGHLYSGKRLALLSGMTQLEGHLSHPSQLQWMCKKLGGRSAPGREGWPEGAGVTGAYFISTYWFLISVFSRVALVHVYHFFQKFLLHFLEDWRAPIGAILNVFPAFPSFLSNQIGTGQKQLTG